MKNSVECCLLTIYKKVEIEQKGKIAEIAEKEFKKGILCTINLHFT